LVIKKYQTGEFTSKLFSDLPMAHILSKPMGQGLGFDKLREGGKVILISGGTGILPFCDFIDILFKRVKYL
jgi:NAD(P)H-flavin reductase